jgi:uncharacterized membrane protein
MNFFEQQKQARKESKVLWALFLVAVVAIIVAVNLAAVAGYRDLFRARSLQLQHLQWLRAFRFFGRAHAYGESRSHVLACHAHYDCDHFSGLAL